MRRALHEAGILLSVLVFALVVWFVIADAENEEIEARLGFSLEVEIEDLGANLVVTGEPLPVTVTVAGREADVEEARPEQFRATLSVRNRAAGRHSLAVRVETFADGVRVRAVQPETAVVILQETVEREVPVLAELANPPPLGFRVGAPEVVPETAVVSGIAFEVEAVEAVVARLDLAGATVAVEREVALEARTALGGAVSQVVVSPRFAQVRVPVEQEVFRRAAAILPNVSGAPAAGYRVRSVRAAPSAVDILVAVEALDEEVEVSTEPIDISGRSADVVTSAALVFADGNAPAADAPTTAQVVIMIEPIFSSVTLPLAIELHSVPPGLQLDSASPLTAEVTLRGPVALLSQLEGPLPPLLVDLSGRSAGRQLLDLRWPPPSGFTLTLLRPMQITVVLSVIPPPPAEPQDEQAEAEPDTGEEEDRDAADG